MSDSLAGKRHLGFGRVRWYALPCYFSVRRKQFVEKGGKDVEII
jgi:hypothetical protein